MNLLENKIRDYFKQNLGLVEDDLSLIDDEYPIKNDKGTSGRIDILAKDSFGHLVIIEIKRSDKTAREAIHELNKYVALLRINYNIVLSKIRCIILSTDWNELIVPFSQFKQTAEYPVEGFKISHEEENIFSIQEEIKEIEISETTSVEPYHEHSIMLFEKDTDRDNAIKRLKKALKILPFINYIVLKIDHNKRNPHVIYPYGIYTVVMKLPQKDFNECTSLINQFFIKNKHDDAVDLRDCHIEDYIMILFYLLCKQIDSYEIGYAEKFCNDLLVNWEVKQILRFGNLIDSKSPKTDKEIIELISGIEGTNSQVYTTIINPKYKLNWEASIKQMQYCLSRNNHWRKIINNYLDESKTDYPDSNYSIFLFNPMNIIFGLQYEIFPYFEIIRSDKKDKNINMLVGFVTWNGKNILSKPEDFIDLDELLLAIHFGEAYTLENKYLKLLGLKYKVIEYEYRLTDKTKVAKEIKFIKNKLKKSQIENNYNNNMMLFAQNNQTFLNDLKIYINSKTYTI